MKNKCLATNLSFSGEGIEDKFEWCHMKVVFNTSNYALNLSYKVGETIRIESSKYIYAKTIDNDIIDSGYEFEYVTDSTTNSIYLSSEETGECDIYVNKKNEISGISFTNMLLLDIDAGSLKCVGSIAFNNTPYVLEAKDFSDSNIKRIRLFGNGNMNGDISDLPNNDYTSIAIQGGFDAVVHGDITMLSNKTNVTYLQFQGNKLHGNIEELTRLIQCETFSFYRNSFVEGDICTLAEGLWRNGKTGTALFDFTGTSCTINGDGVATRATAEFSSNIVIVHGIYTYTYNGSIWTKAITEE